MAIANITIENRYSAGSTSTEVHNNNDFSIIAYFNLNKQTIPAGGNYVSNDSKGMSFTTADGIKFNCAAVVNSLSSSGLPIYTIYYVNEKKEFTIAELNTDRNITININTEMPTSGLDSISVTADSGINHILYNNVTYDTFPATIPLSVDSTEMSIISKNKTSSRLGGVIRRVKNRISNLCENRMEVAYGVV